MNVRLAIDVYDSFEKDFAKFVEASKNKVLYTVNLNNSKHSTSTIKTIKISHKEGGFEYGLGISCLFNFNTFSVKFYIDDYTWWFRERNSKVNGDAFFSKTTEGILSSNFIDDSIKKFIIYNMNFFQD
jgi:hypothetical protein